MMSNQWDTTFACESHYVALRNQTNYIIANLYLTGLSREIIETRRKDQVESFKANKLKKNLLRICLNGSSMFTIVVL